MADIGGSSGNARKLTSGADLIGQRIEPTLSLTACTLVFSVLVAVLILLVWAVTGPLFAFSDTWQLVINTGTTIITFLMVFLI